MKIVLYGASGHGRVVADIVSAIPGLELMGFVDDDLSRHGEQVGKFPVLGGQEILSELRKGGVEGAIATIGENKRRMRIAKVLKELEFQLVTVVHPSAVLAPDVFTGAGTIIMPGVVINAAVRIGSNVIVNTGVTVDHECVLEDGCHLSPGVHLAGNVWVGKEAHVGIGASVIQNIRIGEESVVGAGAVVIRDVPPQKTVVGNPAKELVGPAER